MIERYNSPEISDIWSEYNKFKTYLDVELALVRALEGKRIPDGISAIIAEKAKISPERISEIEKTTKHDIIAFCTSITENLPDDISKYFHFGCTSSDIIDTTLSLQIKKSTELIIKQLKKLKHTLLQFSENNKYQICMGRSHGMNAEPMSFGVKFLGFYAEFSRRLDDLEDYFNKEITGQISGAVGNYTVITPEIEKETLNALGLNVEPVSTQIIPRDRILKLVSITAMIATAVERISTEIRHLHHSDISEVYEGFSKGQKGSSTMPHKKNPISSENLTGIARVIRSHLLIAHENTILWHERDISHSSAERMMLPDNLGLTFYALRRLTSVVENLIVDSDHTLEKVTDEYTYLSSFILHKLIEENNESRENLYQLVQESIFNSKDVEQLRETLSKSSLAKKSDFKFLSSLDETQIRNIYLKFVDTIFQRTTALYNNPSKN